MTKRVLLHISDTHFGTEEPPVVAALQALARELNPDVVVHSGDVTQRARASQFSAARRFCDALEAPHLLVLPGNHDIPLFNLAARLLAPYAGFQAAFGHDLEPVLDLRDVLVVGVNTTRPGRHKDGEVSSSQVRRVAGRLAQARRGQLRVVVTHQPSCVLRGEDEKDRLHGADTALREWARAGADLVLGGHIHLPYVSDACEHVADTQRPLYCVQAGTAVSHRVRHGTPNSVNLVRWEAPVEEDAVRVCVVERWDYELARVSFERTHREKLVLGP